MSSGNWRLVSVGITHKKSSLEEREKLQISREDMAHANAAFGARTEVLESLIVSTCNRVEFYFTCRRSLDPLEIVADFYQHERAIDIHPLHDHFTLRKGSHVADHLFRVAAGIESMVIGENQIMGQLKDAYSSACGVKTAGKVIHRLFHQAFRIGKLVRSSTELGKGACSVSSAAMEMLRSKMGEVDNPSVLFIGVNRMVQLAASNLAKLEHSRFTFANRTPEVAKDFAKTYEATGHGLDELPELIANCDVLVSCTSAKVPVVSRTMIDEALATSDRERLIVVDLAIPRDVQYPKSANPRVDVNDLEEIKAFVADQQHRREAAIPQAEHIIEQKLGEFSYWLDQVMHEPLYNDQGDQIEALRQKELSELSGKLSPELQEQLENVTRRLVSRVAQLAGQAPAKRME
ncbi:glutamyl-tRNA reductase [candidate division GN15 bacterium]|nr:glutamyl-tRNA reductase [candidate division GN15 bacterium]